MFQPTQSQSALVLFLIVGVPLLLGWLGLIVQCANASFKSDGDKVAWILILVLLGPVGAALYLIAGRTRQTRPADREKWVV
ncbi:MAG: PLDc N-terminal domain-containing protein [Geothrix sp.]|uniref:PLDc N-terminal domain-containing protein n=1 Tax=Geothrix sp. TaxID=1962974 RepID=UPI0017A6917C|nr:PLDc N-terminal domain-containing protein [Geothrix sp.]NWJ42580.1 PLDc N-terminal domain-containing protein [Geothrix sp.]WIL19460.1 MAG: PLDc N-terminal domain-containing protein [Geothrix sp.]